MNLRQALIIFKLGSDYNQHEVTHAYNFLCTKIPHFKGEIELGKKALENALVDQLPIEDALKLENALSIYHLEKNFTQEDVDHRHKELILSSRSTLFDQIEYGKSVLYSVLSYRNAIRSGKDITAIARESDPCPVIEDNFKPSPESYNQLIPLPLPFLLEGAPLEVFPFHLLPLLRAVSHSLSFESPRAVPPRLRSKKFTAVLDLDETLLSARDGSITIRQYARDFLQNLAKVLDCEGQPCIEIILFSAAEREQVNIYRRLLDPEDKLIAYSIARGSWFTTYPVLKDLSQLSAGVEDSTSPTGYSLNWGGREGSCILIDDLVHAATLNRYSSLIIPEFQPKASPVTEDVTLLFVLQILVYISHIFAYRASQKIDTGQSGKHLTAAELLKEHPFIRMDTELVAQHNIPYFYLDVVHYEILDARIEQFLTARQVKLAAASNTPSNATTTCPAVEKDLVVPLPSAVLETTNIPISTTKDEVEKQTAHPGFIASSTQSFFQGLLSKETERIDTEEKSLKFPVGSL